MTNKIDQSYIKENGVLLGIIALMVVVVLAVGLPQWTGDDASHDTSKITLPTSLSATLKAAGSTTIDQAALKKQGATADQITQITTQLKGYGKTASASDRSTSHALGFTTASEMYVSKDLTKQVSVRAFNGDGSAFDPGNGQASRVGDAVCFEMSDQSTGQTQATCSHATPDLTVQATAATKKDAAKYAELVFKKLT